MPDDFDVERRIRDELLVRLTRGLLKNGELAAAEISLGYVSATILRAELIAHLAQTAAAQGQTQPARKFLLESIALMKRRTTLERSLFFRNFIEQFAVNGFREGFLMFEEALVAMPQTIGLKYTSQPGRSSLWFAEVSNWLLKGGLEQDAQPRLEAAATLGGAIEGKRLIRTERLTRTALELWRLGDEQQSRSAINKILRPDERALAMLRLTPPSNPDTRLLDTAKRELGDVPGVIWDRRRAVTVIGEVILEQARRGDVDGLAVTTAIIDRQILNLDPQSKERLKIELAILEALYATTAILGADDDFEKLKRLRLELLGSIAPRAMECKDSPNRCYALGKLVATLAAYDTDGLSRLLEHADQKTRAKALSAGTRRLIDAQPAIDWVESNYRTLGYEIWLSDSERHAAISTIEQALDAHAPTGQTSNLPQVARFYARARESIKAGTREFDNREINARADRQYKHRKSLTDRASELARRGQADEVRRLLETDQFFDALAGAVHAAYQSNQVETGNLLMEELLQRMRDTHRIYGFTRLREVFSLATMLRESNADTEARSLLTELHRLSATIGELGDPQRNTLTAIQEAKNHGLIANSTFKQVFENLLRLSDNYSRNRRLQKLAYKVAATGNIDLAAEITQEITDTGMSAKTFLDIAVLSPYKITRMQLANTAITKAGNSGCMPYLVAAARPLGELELEYTWAMTMEMAGAPWPIWVSGLVSLARGQFASGHPGKARSTLARAAEILSARQLPPDVIAGPVAELRGSCSFGRHYAWEKVFEGFGPAVELLQASIEQVDIRARNSALQSIETEVKATTDADTIDSAFKLIWNHPGEIPELSAEDQVALGIQIADLIHTKVATVLFELDEPAAACERLERIQDEWARTHALVKLLGGKGPVSR